MVLEDGSNKLFPTLFINIRTCNNFGLLYFYFIYTLSWYFWLIHGFVEEKPLEANMKIFSSTILEKCGEGKI